MSARIHIPSDELDERKRPHPCLVDAGHLPYVKESIPVEGLRADVRLISYRCAAMVDGKECRAHRGWVCQYPNSSIRFFKGTGRCNLNSLVLAFNEASHSNAVAAGAGISFLLALLALISALLMTRFFDAETVAGPYSLCAFTIIGLFLAGIPTSLVIGILTQPEKPPNDWQNGLGMSQIRPAQRQFAKSTYDDRSYRLGRGPTT